MEKMVVEGESAVPVPPEVDEPEEPEVDEPEELASQEDSETERNESVRDISYHPGRVVFYCPPQQRQKWGDSQILPRVNWGDTFYDLFFVAAAYNVGNIIVASPTARGVLYFVACFFSAVSMWRDKMYWDARVIVEDDLYHRFFEMMIYVAVAFGVVHINPVSIMANSRENPDMFAFAMVVTGFTAMNCVGYLELYFNGVGDRELFRHSALRDIGFRMVPFGLQLAATVIAGVEYFVHGAGANDGLEGSAYDEEKDNDHRMLAGEGSYSPNQPYANDLPIWLLLGAFLAQWALMVVTIQFLFPKDGSHKKFVIPMNINFVIHRDGEWIMLMLGTSILSLLIVDVTEGHDYYTTFFCGILTVVALQYLHYRSQPHNADFHAMRRDKDAGIWWSITNTLYSASLILVGVSYKMFLYDFTYEARRLEEEEYIHNERFLAGSGGGGLSTEERQQAAANVFSASMALVFICLDVMLLFHRGLKTSIGRCQCVHSKTKNYKGIILTVARIALILFFATLSQYENNDPQQLAILGLAGVVAQLIIRQLGFIFFVEDEKEEAAAEKHDGEQTKCKIDMEESKWPNVTHAAAEDANKEKEPEEEAP